MHDLKALRADPAAFDAALARRGLSPVGQQLVSDDEGRRAALAALQEAQGARKALAKEIGLLKRQKLDTAEIEAKAVALRDQIAGLEERANTIQTRIDDVLKSLPNCLDASVPDGKGEDENVVVHVRGEKREFAFEAKQHFELGEALGLMDFPTAAKLSGTRFVVLRGALARLERALGQFMLDTHTTEFGYSETSVPLLVNDDAMYGTDKLPKFAEDSFRTEDGRWLIPTAEVPLTASVMGEILPADALPIRMTALSQCFRSEAGSAGRDVRGMLRQHQFTKCELVSVVKPEDSDAEHERMTQAAETVLERLGITFRRMLLCAGDTGFGAAKTFDLEAWLPGQKAWREISSCSNTRDFQARRMNARYRAENGPAFVNTLNGSGLAVGRTMIAVMETYQNEDGSIDIPEVLRPYMGGLNRIG
ncbi:serine--tRNA ligase [Gluconobacter oxydans]|uniref:Serine--tRNA ligase n=2 Tax=Gluconobacter oxydans TaxID=442 RepID=SYS_GLUOX|nr:serine--tRNA ligase [Gluconobacter oxydans]Q5FQ48.1 RecName: Full=Serine--tRNA ligase; AltName: Full=Seryl-tRNA synthetase; Short=SerRS; AltName: Full=Seryl-tRNA(Ser/Sec) synthetase [Gluconobacter oxydans 621H]AAW61498.1 Seryl-tRNA synthetase [Gluconobacter oxydans 621H]KXV12239.1 serine--tRNA ligase [Gluconobacter oxydans]KXV30168.1 serine--tRNA ligase [Gluconobacter oxydans]MBF0855918.1 serine--tRNA ligase [Gluconobacter oxydans]MCP1248423.1 serine--tRNA ligase [Gluconobacter oxydans]